MTGFGDVHFCDKTGETVWSNDVQDFTSCGCHLSSWNISPSTPAQFFAFGLEPTVRRLAREEALEAIAEAHEAAHTNEDA